MVSLCGDLAPRSYLQGQGGVSLEQSEIWVILRTAMALPWDWIRTDNLAFIISPADVISDVQDGRRIMCVL